MIYNTLLEAKEAALEVDKKLKYDHFELKDFRITNEFKNNNGNTLSVDAISSLATMIGIPKSFFVALHKRDADAWQYLTNKLKEKANGAVLACVDSSTGSILNMFSSKLRTYSANDSLDRLLALDEKYGKIYDKKSIKVTPGNISVDFVRTDKDGYLDLLPGDSYRGGVSVVLSPSLTETPAVSFHLHRVICSNGMTAKSKGFNKNLNLGKLDINSVEQAFLKVSAIPLYEIGEFPTIMSKTNLSMREAEFVHNYLNDFTRPSKVDEKKQVCIIDHMDEKLDMKGMYLKYGFVDKPRKSERWKSSAITNFNAYEIFNHITEQATHNTKLDERESLKLKIFGGELFFRKWDQNDIAPKISLN